MRHLNQIVLFVYEPSVERISRDHVSLCLLGKTPYSHAWAYIEPLPTLPGKGLEREREKERQQKNKRQKGQRGHDKNNPSHYEFVIHDSILIIHSF